MLTVCLSLTFAPSSTFPLVMLARLSPLLRPILVQMNSPFCSATLAPTVVNNVQQGRFELPIEGHLAELQYRRLGSILHLDHTEVPEALEGRGLGKILAKVCLPVPFLLIPVDIPGDLMPILSCFPSFQVAFEYVAAEDLKMKVHCDFLLHYLDKYGAEFKKFQV